MHESRQVQQPLAQPRRMTYQSDTRDVTATDCVPESTGSQGSRINDATTNRGSEFSIELTQLKYSLLR